MEKRKLGTELSVSAVGLGCMGMTFAYGGQDEADAIRTLHRAVDIGVTFFDTAEVYGPFDNEILIGKALKGRWDKVLIATKFGFKIADEGEGMSRMVGVDSRPLLTSRRANAWRCESVSTASRKVRLTVVFGVMKSVARVEFRIFSSAASTRSRS